VLFSFSKSHISNIYVISTRDEIVFAISQRKERTNSKKMPGVESKFEWKKACFIKGIWFQTYRTSNPHE
jgi:hypothetical protein